MTKEQHGNHVYVYIQDTFKSSKKQTETHLVSLINSHKTPCIYILDIL